jgi:hypothetical protein
MSSGGKVKAARVFRALCLALTFPESRITIFNLKGMAGLSFVFLPFMESLEGRRGNTLSERLRAGGLAAEAAQARQGE